jgi:chromate transport protein ChrA
VPERRRLGAAPGVILVIVLIWTLAPRGQLGAVTDLVKALAALASALVVLAARLPLLRALASTRIRHSQ